MRKLIYKIKNYKRCTGIPAASLLILRKMMNKYNEKKSFLNKTYKKLLTSREKVFRI